jgi:hypothetical protein
MCFKYPNVGRDGIDDRLGVFCGEELKITFGSRRENVRDKWRKYYSDVTVLTCCAQMLLGR